MKYPNTFRGHCENITIEPWSRWSLRKWRSELQWHEDSLSDNRWASARQLSTFPVTSTKMERKRGWRLRETHRDGVMKPKCWRLNTNRSKSLLRNISRDRNEREKEREEERMEEVRKDRKPCRGGERCNFSCKMSSSSCQNNGAQTEKVSGWDPVGYDGGREEFEKEMWPCWTYRAQISHWITPEPELRFSII